MKQMEFDRAGRRSKWLQARAAESSYNTKLRQVARQIGALVRGLAPDGEIKDLPLLMKLLEGYAFILKPWAHSVASYMIADVGRRNALAWKDMGKQMSRALRVELQQAPTGIVYRQMMDEQVTLITSLPTEAAARVHRLTTEALSTSQRASTIAKEIMRTGEVTAARATLIARTEVARTASNLTQARARFAGSQGYVWRTSKDSDVRPTHQEMEGVYVPWNAPPKTDKNLAPYHAGCGPNCRCYPDPILPDL